MEKKINQKLTKNRFDSFDFNDPQHIQSLNKIIPIIKKTIKKLELDLDGLVVLTEAATGNWSFLPIIAAMANSKQVLCYTKTTKYGTSDQIKENFKNISKYLHLEKKIFVYSTLDKSIIKKADVVTNSGHLRPINKDFLKNLKKTSVISLMWEPWEFRNSDLDLKFCQKHGISILGTNEHNSIIDSMSYAGDLLEKIFQMTKINVKNKNVILIGENISSIYLYKKLISFGSTVNCISKLCKNEFKDLNANLIGSEITDKKIESFIKKSDLIIICTIPIKKKIIGGAYGLSVKKLKTLNPQIKILVYLGNIDYPQLKKMNFSCYPENEPHSGHMGWTADILGPKVTIETLALGLKTGQILANFRKNGHSARQAELKAIKTPFCLDFPYSIRKKLRENYEN
jgi:hypothetical protein